MYMKSWQKLIIGCVTVVLFLAGFTAFILPGIVRSQAVKQLEATTGRKVSIDKVSINPFTLVVKVDKFRMLEKEGGIPFASFSSARMNFSIRSLVNFAPVVTDAQLTAPYVHIVRTAANTFNFSDLLAGKKSEKQKNEKPFRFSLNNIVVANGSIDFIDRGLAREKTHTVRQLSIAVPFISSISFLADIYVQPRFSALVNGSPLNIEGRLKPFIKGAEAVYDVNLKDLSLPYYLAYYPGTPPVRIDSGRLSVATEVTYRIASTTKPELFVTGKIGLVDLFLRDRTGAPLVSLKQGEVVIGKAAVMARNYALSGVTAEGLAAYLSRDRQGGWNFSRLVEKGVLPEPAEEKKPSAPAPKTIVNIAETHLKDGAVHFSDELPVGGFKADIRDFALDVNAFSTEEGKKATYDLSFATDRGAKGGANGDFSLAPLTTVTAAVIGGVELGDFQPYLAEFLAVPVKGRLDASAGIVMTPEDGVRIEKAEIQARNLSAALGVGEGVKLPRVDVRVAKVSLKERSADLESVAFTGGDIRFSRDKEGKLSLPGLLKKLVKGNSPDKGIGGKAAPGKAAPFRYLVRKISGSGIAVSFTDKMQEDEPRFGISKIRFDLANVNGPKFSPIPFKLSAVYGAEGVITAAGAVTPEPFKLKGDCSVRRLPLTDFDAYLPPGVNIELVDGLFDTRMKYDLAIGKSGLTGTFAGDLGVRNFYALDTIHEEDLLKWESLQLDGFGGSLAPFALNVKEVSLNKYFAKVVVNKDGTVNLQQIYAPEKKEGVAVNAPPQPPSGKPATQPPAPQQRTIRIDAVTLQGGKLSFADHHMSPEFSTTMYNLGGRISGLTSEESKAAEVDLRGNLENQSPLTITGKINPLRDNLFLDLDVKFSDIELSPMSPYSGTFLGYMVDKGKLFLNLKYHIENKKLDSTNKVFLDQFTFGRKVESEKATSLPVRLAVALLKDRKGEIHLDLPVTGRTDDPKFSVWGVVLQILKNLLVKAATSPFALLQSVFGGAEDFSAVHFEAGSARLPDGEKEKLRKLAQAFADRPALKLEVSGFVDRERDPEGYRNELLQEKMKNEKFLTLVKEKKGLEGAASADMVTILPAEYSTYLKAVYRKGKFPKPRNMLGFVKDLPDPEMRKLILANTVVKDEQLRVLAQERATAVRAFLVKDGTLPPERIFEKRGDIYKKPGKEGESRSRVEFGVVAQ
jgi:uncharacterized protein involved in outer membrane biogenesis